jgi:hypothetical protein
VFHKGGQSPGFDCAIKVQLDFFLSVAIFEKPGKIGLCLPGVVERLCTIISR